MKEMLTRLRLERLACLRHRQGYRVGGKGGKGGSISSRRGRDIAHRFGAGIGKKILYVCLLFCGER